MFKEEEGWRGEFKFQLPRTQADILHLLIQSHNKHLQSLPFKHCLHTMESSLRSPEPPGRAPLSRSRTCCHKHKLAPAQRRLWTLVSAGQSACTRPRCCPLQMYSETEDGGNHRSEGGRKERERERPRPHGNTHARIVPCTNTQTGETPEGRCTFPASSGDLAGLTDGRPRLSLPASHVGSSKTSHMTSTSASV